MKAIHMNLSRSEPNGCFRFLRVPLYAIASIIALFSLDAAFFIDTVRDLYEVSVPHPR